MLKDMSLYFSAEKQESLLFVAMGLLAIGIAAWLWTNGHQLKSMAYPLVAIALLQITVGGSVYLRTDAQRSALSDQLKATPAVFKVQESSRMQTVLKKFSIYKAVELVLLLVGVGMVAFLPRNDMAAGIGVGLVLQAAFTLALDVFAEARGADYLSALHSLPT